MEIIIPDKADKLNVGGSAISVECRGAGLSSSCRDDDGSKPNIVSELNNAGDCHNGDGNGSANDD